MMARRTRYRLIFLGLIIVLGSPLMTWLQGLLPDPDMTAPHWAWLHRLPWRPAAYGLPHLSPLLLLGGLLGGFAFAGLGWLSLLIVGMAFFRGRWFCRNLCPTGLTSELAGRMRPKAAKRFKRFPHIAPWLAWLTLGGAVAGYPFFLWIDPLAIFSGFLGIWHKPILWSSLLPGVGLAAIVILSLWRPSLWCFRLCPLGAVQSGIGRVGSRIRRRNKDSASNPVLADRRRFFVLGAGALTALAMRRLPAIRDRPAIIRPPGSAPPDRFNALCARCGHCMRACPQNIIHAAGSEAGLDGWLTPVIRIQPGYCHEQCHACTQVCPTAAIRSMSLEQKRSAIIGTATVDKSHCLAWNMGIYCMACRSACPYDAIDAEIQYGLDCPRVDPERCRGCGRCQTVCPGQGPAIKVRQAPAAEPA